MTTHWLSSWGVAKYPEEEMDNRTGCHAGTQRSIRWKGWITVLVVMLERSEASGGRDGVLFREYERILCLYNVE
jgi:hypothetical protein